MNLVQVVRGLNYLYGDKLLEMKITKIEIGKDKVFIFHDDSYTTITKEYLLNKIEVTEND
jgi:hypothetical protein